MSESYYQSVIDNNDNAPRVIANILMSNVSGNLHEQIDREGFLVPIYRNLSNYDTPQKLRTIVQHKLLDFAFRPHVLQGVNAHQDIENYAKVVLMSEYDLVDFQVEEVRRLITDYVSDILEQRHETYR